jgi:hypothetical protein
MNSTIEMRIRLTFAILSIAAGVHASEVKIDPSELPKPVSDALQARFPQSTILSAAKESDSKGDMVFDIELKHKGRKFETDIKGSGVMLEVEKEITTKQWPKALRHTIDAKYSKATIKEVMEVNKVAGKEEIPDHLEVTVETADKKSSEILTSLDGATIRHDDQASESESAAAEERIKPQDLPKAVVAGVKRKFPKAEITGAEQGKEDGQQIFEVSLKSENHNIDVTLDPSGHILGVEKALSESELPEVLVTELKAKYPHATIKLVEEVWEKEKMTGYEATIITADKKHIELDFDPHGKLSEDSK